MRLPRTTQRLAGLTCRPCETTLFPTVPSTSSWNTSIAEPSQTRVLRTASAAHIKSLGTRRSPLQWSHIAHRVRDPSWRMAGDQQVRRHGGHGHHHHHHDNTYLTSSNKSDPGVRITRIGLYVNLGMAIAKGAGGYVFNSQA